MIFSRRAQSILEYVTLISIVTAAIVLMLPRIKRTTQSMMKTAADQLGDQKGAEQTFNNAEVGYLVSSNTDSSAVVNNLRTDREGTIDQSYSETSETKTTSFTNSGLSEE